MANPTLLLSAGASTYEPPTMTLSWTLDGLTIEKIVAAEDNLFLHKSPEMWPQVDLQKRAVRLAGTSPSRAKLCFHAVAVCHGRCGHAAHRK
jgi:hypothetical protein